MEISLPQSKIIKTIAILMMLCLHLFNRSFEGLFTPVLFIGEQPVSYYISLFLDACVPIFFYMTYFSEIIYAPKYPILIFGWLLLWSLVASFRVNLIYKPILKRIPLK